MDAFESLRMAWRSIRAHRLRSGLTTLGVVIGVGAVITFVTLGASLQGAVIGQVAGAQSPAMTLTAGPAGGQQGPPVTASPAVFSAHDLDRISEIDGVARVVPEGNVQLAGVTAGDRTIPFESMTATTPGYFAGATDATFTAGGPFAAGTDEVVMNERAATLFATNVSVGDVVRIRRPGARDVNATVVGILATPETGGGFGPSVQPRIIGPVGTFYRTTLESPATGTDQPVYPLVTVVATDFDRVDDVQTAVRAYLETDSDARVLAPESYELTVRTNEEFVRQIQDVLGTFTGFITGIAVISLLVGAIGIANIMLVSVTERTKEIGIMKAVGAQNRDVLQLFLVEAALLGLVGAIGGTILGAVGGYAATEFVDIPMTLPLRWAGVAVVVGVAVGLASGVYPAWRGARTDPIDALRYE